MKESADGDSADGFENVRLTRIQSGWGVRYCSWKRKGWRNRVTIEVKKKQKYICKSSLFRQRICINNIAGVEFVSV